MPRVNVLIVPILLFAWNGYAQSPSQPPPLPDQDIVFVIDNSASMEKGLQASDPLRLRGVAASLILDAVELSSHVKAGLIAFSDGIQTDNKLHEPDVIRQRLRPDRLTADGGTNMQPALAAAIGLLGNSTAATRRIVLITDGMPDGNQVQTIPQEIVPTAQAAGIQIFALGLSEQVAQPFLDQVTAPTGGRTLIARKHTELLEIAKQLVNDLDNVFRLPLDREVPGDRDEITFNVPAGVDRVRLTAILDQPKEFEPGEIELQLSGPGTPSDTTYTIRPGGKERVAAWTAFFSSPGDYTLRIVTNKPGGHHGLQLVLEALSILVITLDVVPKENRFTFDDEVRVEAHVTTASGPVNAEGLALTGTVQTPAGAMVSFPFNGNIGTFRVPQTPGKQTIVVRAETSLSRATRRYDYEAIPPCAPQLRTDREQLDFDDKLGPENPVVQESFKLFIEFPPCAQPRNLAFSFTVNSSAGIVELTKKGGGVLRSGPGASYTLPPAGLDLTLRVRLDPKSPLPPQGGTYEDQIRFFSSDTAELKIPFTFVLRIPRFEVKGKPRAFALWWDPLRTRELKIGDLKSDLSVASTYVVTIAEAIHAPNQGPKIADLTLRAGDTLPEPERLGDGRLRYGPLPLPAGKNVPLTLIVTPSRDTGWQNLKTSASRLTIDVRSDLGMTDKIEPVFQTIDWPHGVTIAMIAVLILGLALIALRTLITGSEVRRFWKYRPRHVLVLGTGPIVIDDPGSATAAGLVLPGWGSELDGETLGTVSDNGRQQSVDNTSGKLTLARPVLREGDLVGVKDPNDPAGDTEAWELEYAGFDRNAGGELEVVRNPAQWSLARMLRRLLLALLLLYAVVWFLGSGVMARIAYAIPFIESIYVK